MNVLLIGTLAFFLIHTILWLIRARYNQIRFNQIKGKGKHGGGDNA